MICALKDDQILYGLLWKKYCLCTVDLTQVSARFYFLLEGFTTNIRKYS